MRNIDKAIQRLREVEGAPLSVREIVNRLDGEGFWDEEWRVKVLYAGKARVIRESLREETADGLPRWMPTVDEKWEQTDLLSEMDWKYNIDQRVKGVEADIEKLMRLTDAFENKFGYRYVPEAAKRLGLLYQDTTAEDDWR